MAESGAGRLNDESRLGQAGGGEGGGEFAGRVFEAVIGEGEGAPVHADAGAGAEVAVDLHGFGGVAVLFFHEPAGCVGADGNEGEGGGVEVLADVDEHLVVEGGVAGEEDGSVGRAEEEAGPEASVARAAEAVAPVAGGCGGDLQAGGRGVRLPPIEFDDAVGGKTGGAEERDVAERSDGERGVAAPEFFQRGVVAVVVVVVAEQDDVDGGKVGKRDAGRTHADGAEAVERADAVAEDGIGENSAGAGLQEKGGVADPGGGEADFVSERRGQDAGVGWLRGPGGGLSGAFPAKDVEPSAVFVAMRIEESAAVAMVGDRERGGHGEDGDWPQKSAEGAKRSGLREETELKFGGGREAGGVVVRDGVDVRSDGDGGQVGVGQRTQKCGERVGGIEVRIEPRVPIGCGEDRGHAVVDGCHHGVGRGGDDRARFVRGAVGRAPGFPEGGEGERLVVAQTEEPRFAGATGDFPFVETAGGNQAAARTVGVAEAGFVGEGFGAGVDDRSVGGASP